MNVAFPPSIVLAVVLLATSPVLAGTPADGDPSEPDATLPGYLPDPLEGSGTVAPDGSWEFVAGGLSLRLTPVAPDARWAWIRDRTGAHADPFSRPGGRDAGYLSFLVELHNASGSVISFNPDRIWLSDGGRNIERPLDLAGMESAYRMHDRELPPAFRTAGNALLHGNALLQPGDRRQGLLLFPALRDPARTILVEIPLTTGAGEVVEFKAAWLERDRLIKKMRKHRRREAKRAAKETDRR